MDELDKITSVTGLQRQVDAGKWYRRICFILIQFFCRCLKFEKLNNEKLLKDVYYLHKKNIFDP